MKILKAVDSLNMKLSDYVAYVKDDYKEYPNAFTIDAYDGWLYNTDENKYVVVDSSFDSEEDEYNIVVRHV